MKNTIKIALVCGLINFVALGISAQDRPLHCGEPPAEAPVVPDGSKATVKEIMTARSAVIDFAQKVETYMSCEEERIRWYSTSMTDKQKERWEADLVKINDLLRDTQIKLNEAIRAYRKKKAAE